MPNDDVDRRVRLAAFNWLRSQVLIHGDVLPRKLLAEGFMFQDIRVPLLGPQGIFKPKIIPRYPLSITTAPSGPYNDSFNDDNFLLYRYRGTDPDHYDNVGLREAFRNKMPLLYFHGIVPGKYLAVWPVFVVNDDPGLLTFTVAVEDKAFIEDWKRDAREMLVADHSGDSRRAYLTSSVKQRLHQQGFRARVLRAYHEQCALCRLRHEELLDAAHIIPDGEPDGLPTVNNGIALCKLHHAAFDKYFIGIRPNYIVEVRQDILEEDDGPMLLHGLKGLNMSRMLLPRAQRFFPDPSLLEKRYRRFIGA